MKIAYNGMWSGFDPNNNWFTCFFKDYYGEDIDASFNLDTADIILSSVFSPQNILWKKAKKIFYTGESRTDGYTFDQAFLGFTPTHFKLRIYRLPIWNLYINWWQDENLQAYNIDLNKLCNPLNEKEAIDILSREKFCSMISSNTVDIRMKTFNLISNAIEKVDGYGLSFGSQDGRKKIDIISDYKFNICFENTMSVGYVTEKLFEAKLAGCIPIYWGDKMAEVDFNPRSFINYANFDNDDLFIREIKRVNDSDQYALEIISEPMFNTPPSLERMSEFFDIIGLKG